MVVMQIMDDGFGNLLARTAYLVSYDPNQDMYDGGIEASADLRAAIRFKDVAEAIECWRQTSKTVPTRPDGRPNRPLTAFSVRFQEVEA